MNRAIHRLRSGLTLVSPGLVLLLLALADAEARGPKLVELEDFRREGIRRAVFVLDDRTEVEIEAEGAGDRRGQVLLAQAWILDLQSRHPVWTQAEAGGEYDRRTRNWRTKDRVTLPAGIYGTYFSVHSGPVPLDATIKVFGLELGKIRGNVGVRKDWDDLGDPELWGVRVFAAAADFQPAPVPARAPEPFEDAEIRELGVGDGELREVRFDLDRTMELELYAAGEYVRHGRYFADNVWLVDRDSWERVWSLTPENTEPAGGAEKNRRFAGRIRLEPGSYLLSIATDQTHATGSWNDAPPWDPDAWGAALRVARPEDRPGFRIGVGAARPRPDLALDRVRDDQFMAEPFTLVRDAKLLVRCTGEQVDDSGREFADFGWIERPDELEDVWSMNGALSVPAGGAAKNRLVEEAISLPAGSYRLCYITDDSHAYEDWNAEPPFDPDFWGITLAELDPGSNPALRRGASETGRAVLAIAPVGSDEHIVKRFEVTEPLRVRILAVGEGTEGEMYDYGWLAEASGTRVWEMEYDRTEPAGGARKNRQLEETIDLAPGVYELHYRTDGSHAFGDWNSKPPRKPHLWGVTLVEVPRR